MFTGIIEEIGTVVSLKKGAKSAAIKFSAQKVLSDIHIGDSINTNGTCLTVIHFDKSSFAVDVMFETLERTNLGELKTGSTVNLERALQLNNRLGGHLVSGHIDGSGRILAIKQDDIAFWFTIQSNPDVLKYIIPKGSVAIDGISLTVVNAKADHFTVSIIPHTASETTLLAKKIGSTINIEVDLIGKYIERFINLRDNPVEKNGTIDMDFLSEHGFTNKR